MVQERRHHSGGCQRQRCAAVVLQKQKKLPNDVGTGLYCILAPITGSQIVNESRMQLQKFFRYGRRLVVECINPPFY